MPKSPYRDRGDSVAPLFVALVIVAVIAIIGLATASIWADKSQPAKQHSAVSKIPSSAKTE